MPKAYCLLQKKNLNYANITQVWSDKQWFLLWFNVYVDIYIFSHIYVDIIWNCWLSNLYLSWKCRSMTPQQGCQCRSTIQAYGFIHIWGPGIVIIVAIVCYYIGKERGGKGARSSGNWARRKVLGEATLVMCGNSSLQLCCLDVEVFFFFRCVCLVLSKDKIILLNFF